MCFLFSIFYQTFFISSKKLFSFLRYSIFCYFSLFFPVSRFKEPDQKTNFFKHDLKSKKLLTSSRPLLFFIILSIKRGWVQRKKSSYFFYDLFYSNLFTKVSCIYWLFWLFSKIKKGMELVLTANHLHTFSIKMLLIKYPIKWPSFSIWGEWFRGLRHYN